MRSRTLQRIIRWHDIIALPAYMVSTFITVLGFVLGWWEPGIVQSAVLMVTAWFGGYTFAVIVFVYALKGREHREHQPA